ncbi:MAG: GNAT family N-acetyltransferase [Verrucomicrobia bacterium]|nr:GNAT family N-acetyltransferase [Verrucomicrobiota bacterium]
MVTLRPATSADLPDLERWSFAFERDGLHFPTDPGPPFIAETWRRLASDPSRGEVLVIERDGHAAGYAILVFYWSNEQRGELALLDELWVDPAQRGGVGGEVLRALIARAQDRGAKAIELEVLDGSPRAASLYERHGFATDRRGYWRRL